jgi:hypothetical protein
MHFWYVCFANGWLRFRWKEPHEDEFYSEEVKIVFCALYSTVNQIAAEAYAVQNHDVTKEMVETVSFTPFFFSGDLFVFSIDNNKIHIRLHAVAVCDEIYDD